MKKMFYVLAVLCLTILLNGIGVAATIFVDQTGAGNYTTIQAAINNAANDDIIKVGPGIYRESVNLNKAVQLIGAGPNISFIDSTYNSEQPTNGIDVSVSSPVYISGFTITSSGNGVNINIDSATCTVRNCIISGNTTGIYANKLQCMINVINNTIVSNTNGLTIVGRWNSTVNIKGNIIAFNSGYGIAIWDVAADKRALAYNCVYQNPIGNYSGSASAGTSDITQDPKFIDNDTGNVVLASASPGINTGMTGVAYNDPDGTRNDMGAYAGPDSVAFWPYGPNGPGVIELTVTPASVPKGGTITIRAKGYVR